MNNTPSNPNAPRIEIPGHVTWLEGNGSLLCHDEWHDPRRCHFGALLDGVDGEPPLLLLFNRGSQHCDFILPGTADTRWTVLIDTATTATATFKGAAAMSLEGASLVCLELAAGPACGPDLG